MRAHANTIDDEINNEIGNEIGNEADDGMGGEVAGDTEAGRRNLDRGGGDRGR